MSPPIDVDLAPIRQVLLREARAGITPETIDGVLHKLLTQDFSDVRLVTYLPIFLLRAARLRLRAGLP